MIVAVILFALVASAQVHAKPAKSDDAVPSRKVFFAEVKDAVNAIAAAVDLSHKKVKDADDAGTEATETARIPKDIEKFASRYTDYLQKKADHYSEEGADVSSCTALFNSDLKEILDEVSDAALVVLKGYLKDIADTATKADDQQTQAAAILVRAQEEIRKPDGEYGEEVPAILKAINDLLSLANWNNEHIDAILHGLQWSTDIAISIYTNARSDINASLDYAVHCMSRHVPRN